MRKRLRKFLTDLAQMRHVRRAIAGKAPLLEHEQTSARTAELGERLRLAQLIADEAARSRIECDCARERLGTRDWYDTARADAGGDPVYFEGVDRALRYLDLRGRVFRHPVQHHLVRFER